MEDESPLEVSRNALALCGIYIECCEGRLIGDFSFSTLRYAVK